MRWFFEDRFLHSRGVSEAFFARCLELLPGDGILLLHTITLGKPSKAFAFLRFVHFLSTKIFPGGDVPPPERVLEAARAGGFEALHVECLRPHLRSHTRMLGRQPR